MTHEACAHAVGKSRSAVTNLLRLLNLAEPVREQLMQGALDMGHARALLSLPVLKQIEMAKLVAEKGLSVRETEKLVQALLAGQPAPTAIVQKKIDPDLARLQEDLSDKLGAKVQMPVAARVAARSPSSTPRSISSTVCWPCCATKSRSKHSTGQAAGVNFNLARKNRRLRPYFGHSC